MISDEAVELISARQVPVDMRRQFIRETMRRLRLPDSEVADVIASVTAELLTEAIEPSEAA